MRFSDANKQFGMVGRTPSRRGMTLVELLLVVSIIVMLLAVSVPLMRPAISEGYLREASRQVNGYLTGARARASQLGRDVGVRIERGAAGSDVAIKLSIIEEAPPYSGDLFNARARFKDPVNTGRNDKIHGATFSNSASLPYLVSAGDFVRFDYKGALYEITAVSQAGASPVEITFEPPASARTLGADGKGGWPNVDDNSNGVVDEPAEANPYKEATTIGMTSVSKSDDGPTPSSQYLTLQVADSTFGVPFQIFRKAQRSMVTPLLLAGGTCIDLRFSGYEAKGSQFAAVNANDANHVDILFAPDGSISKLSYADSNNSANSKIYSPSGGLYLLIGRIEQAAGTGERSNLEDPAALWIAVNEQTGVMTTSENDPANVLDSNGKPTLVENARIFARSGQSIGGR